MTFASRRPTKLLLHLTTALVFQVVFGCAGVGLPPFPPAPVVVFDGSMWPDADALVVEDKRELVYRRAEGVDGERLVAVMSHRVRLVVLTERGIARSRIALDVDDYSKIVGFEARSVTAGRESRLNSIDLTPRTDRGLPLERGQVGQVRAEVPGVQVGSVIDYQYQRVFAEPDLVPVLVYGRDMPVLRSEISIISRRMFESITVPVTRAWWWITHRCASRLEMDGTN